MSDLTFFIVSLVSIVLFIYWIISVITRIINPTVIITDTPVNAEIIPFPTKIKANKVETDKTLFSTTQTVSSWVSCILFFPFGFIVPIGIYFSNRSNDRRTTQLAILKALNN